MKKRVSASRTEQIQILMPEHINGAGRLFGGKLVEWIDVVASGRPAPFRLQRHHGGDR